MRKGEGFLGCLGFVSLLCGFLGVVGVFVVFWGFGVLGFGGFEALRRFWVLVFFWVFFVLALGFRPLGAPAGAGQGRQGGVSAGEAGQD